MMINITFDFNLSSLTIGIHKKCSSEVSNVLKLRIRTKHLKAGEMEGK